MKRVFIDGSAGTTGLRIRERLEGRPDLELICLSGELRKALVRCAIASAADMAVIPIQDIIGAGDEGRMNAPSTVGTNWTWRFDLSELSDDRAESLAFLSKIYGRNL